MPIVRILWKCFFEINIMNVQIKYWHCFTWKERYSNVFRVGRKGVHSLYVRLFELLTGCSFSKFSYTYNDEPFLCKLPILTLNDVN